MKFIKKYERLICCLCFLSWDDNAAHTSECTTFILPPCVFSEDHKKHLQNVIRCWSVLEGPTEAPHSFSFPFLPLPSFPPLLHVQSAMVWAEGDEWVASLCCTGTPMGAPLGISGIPRGGEKRDGGLTVSLAPSLPPWEIFVSYQLNFFLPVWECRSH